MNNACAWFSREYPGCKCANFMIIPTANIASAAGFNQDVRIIRKTELARLTARVRGFFKEFATFDLSDLSERKISELISLHKLDSSTFTSEYSVAPRFL